MWTKLLLSKTKTKTKLKQRQNFKRRSGLDLESHLLKFLSNLSSPFNCCTFASATSFFSLMQVLCKASRNIQGIPPHTGAPPRDSPTISRSSPAGMLSQEVHPTVFSGISCLWRQLQNRCPKPKPGSCFSSCSWYSEKKKTKHPED